MIREIAAKRYAEAVYLLVRESGNEEAWTAGLAAMAALFGDPRAQAVLEDTRRPPADKLKLVEAALARVDPLVLNLARLLLRRGRTALGLQIAEAFQQLLDEARGIAHAVVTTAVPLSEEEAGALARRLSEITGGQVLVVRRVDESILGGLIARIGDRVIDGTTRSKLAALKRRLQEARA